MLFLTRRAETVYAVLRIVSGVLFACHGAQKLFGVLGGQRMTDPLMVVAGIIEFAGGLCIAAGFYTTIAAFIASGMMAVAYFMAHAPQGFVPIVNKGEMAVLYCFLFLYISAHGSGPLSIDARLRRH